jgi:hypothetical protein
MNINNIVYEKATSMVQDNRLMDLLHDWQEMPRPLWNGAFETADTAIAIPIMARYGWNLAAPYSIWDWFDTVKYVVKMYFLSEFHIRLNAFNSVSDEDMACFRDFLKYDLGLHTLMSVAYEFKGGHLSRACTERYIRDILEDEYDMEFTN